MCAKQRSVHFAREMEQLKTQTNQLDSKLGELCMELRVAEDEH